MKTKTFWLFLVLFSFVFIVGILTADKKGFERAAALYRADAEAYQDLEKFEVGCLQLFWGYNDETDLTPEIQEESAATIRVFAMDHATAMDKARRSGDPRWITLCRMQITGQFDAAAFLQRQLREGPIIKDKD